MPPKYTPSQKWAGAILHVLEPKNEVQSNERGSLMVIDRAHKDRLGLAGGAAHSAHLMKSILSLLRDDLTPPPPKQIYEGGRRRRTARDPTERVGEVKMERGRSMR